MRGKKLLITGSTGFLGNWIRSTASEKFRDFELLTPSRSELDLTDLQAVREYWAKNNPTSLIHAAAFARGLGGNIDAKEFAFIENEAVARPTLLAAMEFGVESLVYCGTVAEYGYPYSKLPLDEGDVYVGEPHSGEQYYGLAKRLCEPYLSAIRLRWGAQVTHALLTNLYGPGDRFDPVSGHVVASMLHNFAKARDGQLSEIVLWGLPDTTRDFLFVRDAAFFILDLLGQDAGLVNVASGTTSTMGELAEKIAELTQFRGSVLWDSGKPIGIKHRSVDVQKLSLYSRHTPLDISLGLQMTARLEDWITKQ